MQVQAQQVRPGDRVRGIGLVVEYSEPATDFTTHLEGYVRGFEPDGNEVRTPAAIDLPNDHRVRVVRPFQGGDEVTVAAGLVAPDIEGLPGYVRGTVLELDPHYRRVLVEWADRQAWVDFRQARHALPQQDDFEVVGSDV